MSEGENKNTNWFGTRAPVLIVSVIVGALFGVGRFGSLKNKLIGQKPSPTVIVAKPRLLSAKYEDIRGLPLIGDHGVRAYGTIKNEGFGNEVRLTVKVFENGKLVETAQKDLYIPIFQPQDFSLYLMRLKDVDNPHDVKFSVEGIPKKLPSTR